MNSFRAGCLGAAVWLSIGGLLQPNLGDVRSILAGLFIGLLVFRAAWGDGDE